MSIAAFDVDLHRIHGWSDTTGKICYNASAWPLAAMREHDLILIEIASPVSTASKAAEDFNRRRWALSNMYIIGSLAPQWHRNNIFVSPSTLWTLGHDEKMREMIAGVAGTTNHDLRACQCMLYYHRTNPTKWVPLKTYLEEL